jgi:hypothetical protein
MTTVRPLSADPVLAPLLRPRTLGKSGTYAMAPKPALQAKDPEKLRRERVIALAFGDVIDAAGLSNCDVADLWGCSEVIVRNVRSRKCPLAYDKVLALPKDVRAALDAEAERRMSLNDSLPMVDESLRAASALTANDHYRAL